MPQIVPIAVKSMQHASHHHVLELAIVSCRTKKAGAVWRGSQYQTRVGDCGQQPHLLQLQSPGMLCPVLVTPRYHNIRPGWVTVGSNLTSSNFNPQVCFALCWSHPVITWRQGSVNHTTAAKALCPGEAPRPSSELVVRAAHGWSFTMQTC